MSISSADLGHGTEAAYGFGGDWAHAAEAGLAGIPVSSADSAHAREGAYGFGGDWARAAEAGSVAGPGGSTPRLRAVIRAAVPEAVTWAIPSLVVQLQDVPGVVAGGDSAHAAEAARATASPSTSDAGHAVEGSSVHASLAGTDTGHAAEAGSAATGPAGADTGRAAEGTSLHAALSGADSGHAVEAGSAGSQTAPHSADHALATESAFYYHPAADSAAAAEGSRVRVSGADRVTGAGFPVKAWPSARDASVAADRPLRSWPGSADAGHGTEAVRPFPVSRGDSAAGSDSTHEIGIWTYVPQGVRLLLKGRYRPPVPPERLRADREKLTAAVQRLLPGTRWARLTLRVSSKDRASAAEKGSIPERRGD